MKFRSLLFVFILQTMLVSVLHAQLSGTKTIPGDYATIADAITAVNTSGVTSPGVTFNIAPGHTEIGVNYTINTSTSSSTSPIIFQRFGFGDNPKITVSAGSAAVTDAGVKIAGSDYVTFDGIDIDASAQTTIEWGYAFVKKNGSAPFDGCQYVTIKNCTITLNKTNTNSVGIYAANHTATSTTGLSITSTTDAHNNCRFYNNSINNCSSGISIIGYSTYTLHDQNNDIGGTSVSTGNIIQNFGNSASAAYGIKVANQNNFNIGYNTIDNTAGGGSIQQNSLYGIHFGAGTAATFSIVNNNLTLKKGSGSELTGIYNNFNSTTGPFNINYNLFDGCRNETSNSSETDFIFINSYGYNVTLNVRNNSIKNSFSKKDIYVIKNKGFFTTVNIANNYVYNIETEGGFHGIFSDYFSGPGNEYRCTDIISGNTLFNIRAKTDLYGIESRNSAMYKEITSNTLDSLCALPSVAPPIITSNNCTGIYFIPHSSSYNPDSVWFNSNTIRRLFSQNYTTGIKLDNSFGYGCNAGPYRFNGNEICWLISSYNYKDSAAYTVGCDLRFPVVQYSGNTNLYFYNNIIHTFETYFSKRDTILAGVKVGSADGKLNSYLFNNTIAPSYKAGNVGRTIFRVLQNVGIMDLNTNLDLRNNILICGIYLYRSSSNLTTYSGYSNNNMVFGGYKDPLRFITVAGLPTSGISLDSFKIIVAPRDSASFNTVANEIGMFVQPERYIEPIYLIPDFHLRTDTVTYAESEGIRITSPLALNRDFDGDLRWGETGYSGTGTAPDVGADEGNFIPEQVMKFDSCIVWQGQKYVKQGESFSVIGINLYVTGTKYPIKVTNFSLNANGTTAISDINSQMCTIAGGSAYPTISNFNVTTNYLLHEGENIFGLTVYVNPSATIHNLIDAECLSVTAGGLTKIPGVTAPSGYTTIISSSAMSGNYYIGQGQTYPNYPTLTMAVEELKLRLMGGPINFYLTNNSETPYSESNGEVFPINLSLFQYGNYYPLLIKPTNTGAKIISNTASYLLGVGVANNLTIDGSASGTERGLTIENTVSDYPAVLFSQLARGNTIKNSIVKAKGHRPGVICVGLPDTTNQYDTRIDSINIINCEITGTISSIPYSGIYFNVDYWLTHDASGMVVRNCDIHDCSAGIYNNWKLFSPVFEGNNIYSTSTAGNFRNYTYGIYIKSEALNLSINKNKIFDLSNNISGSNVVGIYSTNSRVAQTDTIENNIISLGSTFNNNNCTVTGIKISDSSVTSPDTWFIFGNSVKINGSSITSGLSSCFIKSGTSNINSKNNVFYNSRSGGTEKHYAIYVSNAAGTEVFDFNDYFTDGTNGMLGYWLNTDLNNLSTWRNTTYQDSFSVSGNPGFSSETNLQPDISNQYSWNLNGKGVQIPSLNYDINGISRSTTVTNGAPDIGAYEFTPSCNPAPAAESGTKTDGGTTIYNVAGNAIASITWHGSDLPVVQVFYYSGANPLNTIPGSKFGNYYLDVSPTGGSNFTYDMKIFYTHPLAGTITAENNIRIAKTNASGNWVQYESILNTSGHYTEIIGLNSFSHFTIADNNSPLPVSLSSFTSSIDKRDVSLIWVTLFENNNSGFEIHRSEDRTNWNNIGFLAGAGTVNTPVYYKFEDKKLNTGKYSYRLKQIDNNGNYTFHELGNDVEIGIPNKFALTQNYPNPFNPVTKIDYDLPVDGYVSMIVYDITGREIKTLVNENKKAGYYTIEFSAANLSSGVYFYRILAKDFTSVKKMVILK